MKRTKRSIDLFTEIKIKMVMKIYGLSRSKAIAKIAGREAAATPHAGDDHDIKTNCRRLKEDEEFMSAEEFFGG